MTTITILNLWIVLALFLGLVDCQSDLDDLLLEAISAPENLEPQTAGFYDLSEKTWEDINPDTAKALYKKALSGFMGVRGKKDDQTFLEYEKKSIPSGFMGVRGKKKTYFPFYKSDFGDKRMLPMFIAMRGKKNRLDDKRVPLGFYGLRGR